MKAPYWLTKYVVIVSLFAFIYIFAIVSGLMPYTTSALFLLAMAISLPTYLGLYANSKIKQGRLASNLVRAGLFLDSKNITLIFVRAQLLMQKGDFEAAEDDINFLIARNPKGYHGFNLRTLLNLQRCDFSEAEEDCERILKKQPNNAVTLLNRAVCRLQLGNLEGAMADCEAALKQKKYVDNINFVKFATLLTQHRHDQAEVILQALEAKKADSFYTNYGRALMHGHHHRYEEVLKICAQSQDETHFPHYLGVQVQAYLGLNEGDLALSTANHLIHQRPSFYSGYLSRAAVLIDCEMYDAALVDLNMLASLQPYLGACDALHGYISFGHKRYEEAIEFCDRALGKNCRNLNSMVLKARAFLELGRCEEASALLNEAQEIQAASPYVLVTQALLASKVEGAEKALQLLNRALDIDPHYREGYRIRSNVFKEMGDAEKANADWQRFEKFQKQLFLGVRERLDLAAGHE